MKSESPIIEKRKIVRNISKNQFDDKKYDCSLFLSPPAADEYTYIRYD